MSQRRRGNVTAMAGLNTQMNTPAKDHFSTVLAHMREQIPADMQAEMIVNDDGSMVFPGFQLTARGLAVTGELTIDGWVKIGRLLRRLKSSLQMFVGDWCAYGERVWGKSYEDFAAITGYKVASLYELARVMRAVDFSIRIEKLHFGHYQIVAALPPAEQATALQWAVDSNASIAQFRQHIFGKPSKQLESPAERMGKLATLAFQNWDNLSDLKPDQQEALRFMAQEILRRLGSN
jgi:hypothetical protein